MCPFLWIRPLPLKISSCTPETQVVISGFVFIKMTNAILVLLLVLHMLYFPHCNFHISRRAGIYLTGTELSRYAVWFNFV